MLGAGEQRRNRHGFICRENGIHRGHEVGTEYWRDGVHPARVSCLYKGGPGHYLSDDSVQNARSGLDKGALPSATGQSGTASMVALSQACGRCPHIISTTTSVFCGVVPTVEVGPRADVLSRSSRTLATLLVDDKGCGCPRKTLRCLS